MTGIYAACAVVFLGLTISMALGWRELQGRAGLAQFATGYGVVVASAFSSRDAVAFPSSSLSSLRTSSWSRPRR